MTLSVGRGKDDGVTCLKVLKAQFNFLANTLIHIFAGLGEKVNTTL